MRRPTRCSPPPRGSHAGVDVPVTVDAEAGYGMEPAELVAALRSAGAAGCNLEDTDHAAGGLRDPDRHAEWLRAVRQAASEDGYPLVINARVDVFFGPLLAGAGPGTQDELVPEALRRAHAYIEAGVDCVYPIGLWEADALRRFIAEVSVPVNVVRLPQAPSLAELAALGVARVSWGAVPVLRRDGSLRRPARVASGVRRAADPARTGRGARARPAESAQSGRPASPGCSSPARPGSRAGPSAPGLGDSTRDLPGRERARAEGSSRHDHRRADHTAAGSQPARAEER